ncbi:glycosyltransferase family 2 protein [Enterococcus pseudoavium]|uniref:Glycosyltransferase family 2 protein n=1 Tax=Enterococcus pseudoavium TaxID=44007 RepID=A0ABU3FFU8_9ENTE|nr:glycosyltransferase family 2 protein [Enterococcus pseudoavium]MDT2769694.1 glycosyltransferase family 2 protein [Enterococcus pseudoavium]
MKVNSENKIDLSVIVPVYNVKETLCRAVESIVNQNLEKIEIILVDDGSTDGSQYICDDLEKKHKFVNVIHKENGGLSSARNVGIIQAQGEYITFIDSDDYYTESFFEEAIKKLNNDNGDIFVFGLRKGSQEKSKELVFTNEICSIKEEAIKKLFLEKAVDFYAWNKIYRHSLFKEIRYPEGHLYEDVIPTYLLFKKAKKIIISDKIGIFYYSNPNSIVNQQFSISQYDNVLQRIKLLEYIKSDYPELKYLAVDKLVDGFLSTGFKISCADNQNKKEFLKKLRTDISSHFFGVFGCSKVSISKKIGLIILFVNSKLYKKIYSLVLGKGI